MGPVLDGWTVLLAALFLGGVFGAAWWAGQWLLQRERTWSDALGAVMAATVVRRDRIQTLSIILERSVEALQAANGSIHIARKDRSGYELVNAVNVERLDLIVELPADEAFVQQISGSLAPFLFESTTGGSPWRALGTPPAALVGLRLGEQALLVLSWPNVQATWRHLPALQSIQRYAEQVLVEFDDVDARAADIQTLTAILHRQELVSQTAAHDLAHKYDDAKLLLSKATEMLSSPGEAVECVRQALVQLNLSEPLLHEFYEPDRRLEREALVVEDLVRLAAAMVERRRRYQMIQFALEVQPALPAVWGERLAVLRVLDNLLSNALQHNGLRADLNVWLRVWAENECVAFEVGDNGSGIADDAQADLFQLAFRLDGTGRLRGHGLGLWSSRRLVEAMGGQIWMDTETGRGARFTFILPTAPEGPSDMDSAGAAGPAVIGEPTV